MPLNYLSIKIYVHANYLIPGSSVPSFFVPIFLSPLSFIILLHFVSPSHPHPFISLQFHQAPWSIPRIVDWKKSKKRL